MKDTPKIQIITCSDGEIKCDLYTDLVKIWGTNNEFDFFFFTKSYYLRFGQVSGAPFKFEILYRIS